MSKQTPSPKLSPIPTKPVSPSRCPITEGYVPGADRRNQSGGKPPKQGK